jgi:hypothetical protein
MRSIVVQAGPLAAGTSTKIATAQRPRAAGALALIGAASNTTSTSVCASQSPGAAAFTINGTQATGGAAYLQNQFIYITSGGDDHSITFAVVGLDVNSASQTETLTGTNAQSVASTKTYTQIISITPSGAVASTVTVGSYTRATLDTARRVLFTLASDESGNTAVITGTDWAGDAISETVTLGSSATYQSVLDYKTVSSVTVTAAGAGNISVGTNGVASSQWVYLDGWAMSQIGIQCTVSGTVNYTVQQTLDDPNSPTNPVAPASMTWVNHADPALVSATSTQQSNYAYPPVWSRIVLNSESGTGSVAMTMTQALSAVY